MSSPWQTQFKDWKSRSQHLLETKVLSDCTFAVGKGTVQTVEGHKFLFSVASPPFYDYLKAGGDHPKVILTDIEPEIFQAMMKYVYTDNIDINANSVYDLAAAAKAYELPGLLKACLDTINANNLTSKNVLQAYSLALHANENDVKKKCEEFIENNTKAVLAEGSFEEACLDVVEAVFSLENLNIDSELELLKAADRYSKHVESTCKEAADASIRNVLSKIRFLSLTPEEFAKEQSATSVLVASDACAILQHIAYDKSAVPFPSGFSLRKDPRKKVKDSKINPIKSPSEIKFEFTVPDVDYCIKTDEDTVSSTFELRNLKWKISSGTRTENSEKCWGIFAYCNWESESSTWSCNASVNFELLRDDKTVGFEKKFTNHKFIKSESNWGYNKFLLISDLVNPKNKYIKDGAITFRIHIAADEPEGL